jgi:hypothetical protein
MKDEQRGRGIEFDEVRYISGASEREGVRLNWTCFSPASAGILPVNDLRVNFSVRSCHTA